MCWKTTLYGFNQKTGMDFQIEVIATIDELDGLICSYLELPYILLHSAESERTDEC